jgi:Spy/CpxP family protein refolding chaperone
VTSEVSMPSALSLSLAVMLVLGTTVPVRAQSGHAHRHAGGGDAEAHRRVEACQREFDEVVADGRGFGLAFAADQNGYPGPLHVLELKDRLQLTAEQETRTRALFESMLTEARARAGRLAAAEARLTRLFASSVADDGAVRAAVAEAEAARAEVRLAHLLTHLRTRDLLTEAQRHTYHAIRWGAGPRH